MHSRSTRSRRPRTTADRLAAAVRWAGRLLCWTLAVAMPAAAAEAVVAPQADCWQAAWQAPWYLVPVWALAWAVLRIREKYVAGRDDEEDVPADFDRAA
ncbi:hypothetical protein ACFVYF_24515 [Streptomyces sp. NPDC058274]|uniref:hypothetical protein n=1 Tax=Streptomyces sp. NPDC058274 TaxID=3346416 RepID=UPI0036E461A8